jgi:hypothetical protein
MKTYKQLASKSGDEVEPSPHASQSDLEAVRARLVDEAQRKPLLALFQFDALITGEPEAGHYCGSFGTTDEDGDCVNCELKHELRNTANDVVRIQIPLGVTPSEAVRVLRKTAGWIQSRPDVLDPEDWDGLGRNDAPKQK